MPTELVADNPMLYTGRVGDDAMPTASIPGTSRRPTPYAFATTKASETTRDAARFVLSVWNNECIPDDASEVKLGAFNLQRRRGDGPMGPRQPDRGRHLGRGPVVALMLTTDPNLKTPQIGTRGHNQLRNEAR